MTRFAKANVPNGRVEIACIKRLPEDLLDPFMAQLFLAFGFWKERVIVQEPFRLHLGFKPATCKAFKGFGEDAGHGFIPHQHLSLMSGFLVAIPYRYTEGPVSVEDSRSHAVDRLLRIFS